MNKDEFIQNYLIPCKEDWCINSTTHEEFIFWLECNGFNHDDEKMKQFGHPAWSRYHSLDCGEIMFLVMTAKHLLPKIYYCMEIKFTPNNGESVVYSAFHNSENTFSYANVYRNINLAMTMAINSWNNHIRDMDRIIVIPMIPNHWMIPITNVITTIGKV